MKPTIKKIDKDIDLNKVKQIMNIKNLKVGNKVVLERKLIYAHYAYVETGKQTIRQISKIKHERDHSVVSFKGMNRKYIDVSKPIPRVFRMVQRKTGSEIQVFNDKAKYELIGLIK